MTTTTNTGDDFAYWMLTHDYVDGSQRNRYRTRDPAITDWSEIKAKIEYAAARLHFRMQRHGKTLYAGWYVGPLDRTSLREQLVMVGAPLGQCWDIHYLSEAGR